MSNKRSTPMHHKLLVVSYLFATFSTLLAALAAISAASDGGKLMYPDINNPTQPINNSGSNAKKYFEL